MALKQFKKFKLIANMQAQLWILRPKTSYPIPEEEISKSENIHLTGTSGGNWPCNQWFPESDKFKFRTSWLAFHRKLMWPIKYNVSKESLYIVPLSNLCLFALFLLMQLVSLYCTLTYFKSSLRWYITWCCCNTN